MRLPVGRQEYSHARTFEDELEEYLESDEAIRDLGELDQYDPFANEY